MEDETKVCIDCGEDYIYSVSDQVFYAKTKGEDGVPYVAPKRCKPCRIKKKERMKKDGRD